MAQSISIGALEGNVRHAHHARRQCRLPTSFLCRSLAPKDEHFDSQGVEGHGAPPRAPHQDWRAFRAHLVGMERKGQWIPSTFLNNSSASEGTGQRLLWAPSGSQDSTQYSSPFPSPFHLPTPESRSSNSHDNDSTSSSRSSSSSNSKVKMKRPVHPSSRGMLGEVRPDSTAVGPEESTGWAHELVQPEVGCVMVAKQDAASMGIFRKAVVLIVSHDNVNGTMGVVLNKQMPLTVSELTTNPAIPGFQEVFSKHQLQFGGPVSLNSITLVHRYRGLKGAVAVTEGLYTGGLPDAIQLVQSGLASTSDFMLCLGMTAWAPGQLQAELEQEYWHCIAGSPELLLGPQQLQPPHPTSSGSGGKQLGGSRVHPNNSSASQGSSNCKAGEAAKQKGQGSHSSHAHKKQGAQQATSGAAPSPQHQSAQRLPSKQSQQSTAAAPHKSAGQSSVPPRLQPPPSHPAASPQPGQQPSQVQCLWRRVLKAAQLC